MASVRQIVGARFEPRSLKGNWVMCLQYLMAFNAIVRGLDYVTGSSSRVADLVTVGTLINQIVNLAFWGWAFLGFGVVLGVALLLRRHFFIFVGHGVLLAAYAMLMVSAGQAVWQLHDDFRALIPPFGGIILHGFFAIRLKPWPREVIAPSTAESRGDDPTVTDREEYL